MDYSIKSYLDLAYPENQIEVIVESKTRLSIPPGSINLEVIKENAGNDLMITVKPES